MRWILGGWGMFIASALFFILASWRAGDMLALTGSVLFLLACFSFLVPVAVKFVRIFRRNRR